MSEQEHDFPDHEAEMSFLDHLEALRWHLIRSVMAIFTLAILAFLNRGFIFDTVLLAAKSPDFITYRLMCAISDRICIEELPFILINISMSGQFTNHIFVSVAAGFIVAFPYVFWEIWRFIKPALYAGESKHATGVVFFSSLLFLSGVLFGYYIIAPMAVNFLGSYQVSKEVANQINLGSYITTVATIPLACGVVFELPVVTFFLTRVGLVNPSLMRKYRKHALVMVLILAAVITPPDVISQILVAMPLLLLYELSIGISTMVLKKQAREE
jgi:sec-independent protein translocase protein TatC